MNNWTDPQLTQKINATNLSNNSTYFNFSSHGRWLLGVNVWGVVLSLGKEVCQSISVADVEMGAGFRLERSTVNPDEASRC